MTNGNLMARSRGGVGHPCEARESPLTFALLTEGSSASGLGHMMRCAAITEVLAGQGCLVNAVLVQPVVPWGLERLRAAGARTYVAPDLAAAVTAVHRLPASALVIDIAGHQPNAACLADSESARPVMVFDDEGRDLPVSAVVSPHPLAEELPFVTRADTRRLFGPSYCLVRSSVRSLRIDALAAPIRAVARRILVAIGGSDVSRIADRLAEAALASATPVHVRAVAADNEMAERLASVSVDLEHTLQILEVGSDLAADLAWADVAVTSASTMMWEACCLGRAVAALAVAPGQVSFWKWAGACGVADAITVDSAHRRLGVLVHDPILRHRLAISGAAAVDGNGARRVSAELHALAQARTKQQSDGQV